MTTTLEAIHHDPAILDRAIASHEPLHILADGKVAATLLPAAPGGVEEARRIMHERFAAPDWEFSVGQTAGGGENNPPPAMTMSEFIDKWAGAFSVPSRGEAADDARMTYLLEKHVK